MLACTGYGDPPIANISWIRDGRAVAISTTRASVYEEEIIKGEQVFQHSLLQLCSLVEADSGAYTCVASNDEASANHTVKLLCTCTMCKEAAVFTQCMYNV